MILVDDHLLLRVLAAQDPDEIASEEKATTTLYWYRAMRPLLADGPSGIHGAFAEGLGPVLRRTLLRGLADVRDRGIVVPDSALLVPAMARLAATERVNYLAAEAAVAAFTLGASIRTAAGNLGEPLRRAAGKVGVDAGEI